MDIRFDTWNVRSLYSASLLMAVVKEMLKSELDLVEYRRSDGTGVVPNC
jgi:hypothetical protein